MFHKTRKYNTISNREKTNMVRKWETGNFYLKEILKEHHISYYTFKLCCKYVKEARER